MLISASTRTDIPAFYSEWLYQRIKEGFVYVRNPYNAHQVSEYRLSPEVVDAIILWTKNPLPMMERIEELRPFHPYFFVTVTPYGREVEPFVPPVKEVLAAMRGLSDRFGRDSICLRYDPIFIDETYTLAYHKKCFTWMAEELQGKISECVISFVDLYEKTKRNFKSARPVYIREMEDIAESFSLIAKQHGFRIKTCAEAWDLKKYGIENAGCISRQTMERHLKAPIIVKSHKANRENCTCIESKDIGAYNTCPHGCKYCYANYDERTVRENIRNHDPHSPFLIGTGQKEDVITKAKQESIIERQMRLDFLW